MQEQVYFWEKEVTGLLISDVNVLHTTFPTKLENRDSRGR